MGTAGFFGAAAAGGALAFAASGFLASCILTSPSRSCSCKTCCQQREIVKTHRGRVNPSLFRTLLAVWLVFGLALQVWAGLVRSVHRSRTWNDSKIFSGNLKIASGGRI